MENQKTWIAIGVTSVAGLIGYLGWNVYSNGSFDSETARVATYVNEVELPDDKIELNAVRSLKMSTPTFLSSFWNSEFKKHTVEAMETE
jgi:predicted negative regulator of RcsB-dependent stress response|uniref:Uncharacterized protein n=1 Tax=viral metagenome TaxID=1070528 RepID=A0A6C0IQ92_9ZZZZ